MTGTLAGIQLVSSPWQRSRANGVHRPITFHPFAVIFLFLAFLPFCWNLPGPTSSNLGWLTQFQGLLMRSPTTNALMRSGWVTVRDVMIYMAANPMQAKPAAFLLWVVCVRHRVCLRLEERWNLHSRQSNRGVSRRVQRDKLTLIGVWFVVTARTTVWSVQYGPSLFVNDLKYSCQIGVWKRVAVICSAVNRDGQCCVIAFLSNESASADCKFWKQVERRFCYSDIVTALRFVWSDRSLTSGRPFVSKVSLTDGRCLLPFLSLIFRSTILSMVLFR